MLHSHYLIFVILGYTKMKFKVIVLPFIFKIAFSIYLPFFIPMMYEAAKYNFMRHSFIFGCMYIILMLFFFSCYYYIWLVLAGINCENDKIYINRYFIWKELDIMRIRKTEITRNAVNIFISQINIFHYIKVPTMGSEAANLQAVVDQIMKQNEAMVQNPASTQGSDL